MRGTCDIFTIFFNIFNPHQYKAAGFFSSSNTLAKILRQKTRLWNTKLLCRHSNSGKKNECVNKCSCLYEQDRLHCKTPYLFENSHVNHFIFRMDKITTCHHRNNPTMINIKPPHPLNVMVRIKNELNQIVWARAELVKRISHSDQQIHIVKT